MKDKYIVVCDSSLSAFIKKVNVMLDNGYKVHGGMTIDSYDAYHQAMTLK